MLIYIQTLIVQLKILANMYQLKPFHWTRGLVIAALGANGKEKCIYIY